MKQEQITLVGNTLIHMASKMNAIELQDFFDDLEYEARELGADESMPLGWVARQIDANALDRGIVLKGDSRR